MTLGQILFANVIEKNQKKGEIFWRTIILVRIIVSLKSFVQFSKFFVRKYLEYYAHTPSITANSNLAWTYLEKGLMMQNEHMN